MLGQCTSFGSVDPVDPINLHAEKPPSMGPVFAFGCSNGFASAVVPCRHADHAYMLYLHTSDCCRRALGALVTDGPGALAVLTLFFSGCEI